MSDHHRVSVITTHVFLNVHPMLRCGSAEYSQSSHRECPLKLVDVSILQDYLTSPHLGSLSASHTLNEPFNGNCGSVLGVHHYARHSGGINRSVFYWNAPDVDCVQLGVGGEPGS